MGGNVFLADAEGFRLYIVTCITVLLGVQLSDNSHAGYRQNHMQVIDKGKKQQ